MDNQTRIFKLKETFDAASKGYDRPALRFFNYAADHLADRMALMGSEHILDVACGTGAVSLACDNGSITSPVKLDIPIAPPGLTWRAIILNAASKPLVA